MRNIEIKILVPQQLEMSEKMMVAMARLTQHSHEIACMDDFMALLNKPYSQSIAEMLSKLPHPTLQKFGLIHIVIVGASRRFLAQITRHQNEIKFMSGSLQYSDYSESMNFCVPYEVTKYDKEHPELGGNWALQQYINSCLQSMDNYKKAAKLIGNDAAGYMAPPGMRNVLVLSALPYELKHIISQRSCCRNSLETQYILLKIWEQLYTYPMFRDSGPDCMDRGCREGKLSCGHPMQKGMTPTDILHQQFPYFYEEDDK